MPISQQARGQDFLEREVEITTRRILAYAAGIGDSSDAAFDDAGDLTALPQLCVSLEWPVVSHPSSRQHLGAAADELRRGVHAVQDSIFHRPVRPGDRLVTRGRLIGLRDTRAGALLLTRLDTTEVATGTPVVTSWSTSIYRGVPLEPAASAQGIESAPATELPPPLPDVSRGEIETVRLAIPREMPHVYTECAEIWNPIHTEREVALAAGLPDIILHGTATWALAGREVIRRFADRDPRRLRRLCGEFRAMIIPGTVIEIDLWARPATEAGDRPGDPRAIGFVVRNEAGEEAIRSGVALVDNVDNVDNLERSVA